VTLVTDSLACQRTIDAYNSRIASGDTLVTRISRAYVLLVGTTVYAMIPVDGDGVYIYFDRMTFAWLAAMVAPE